MNRRGALGLVAGGLVVAGLVLALVRAGEVVRRPEGAAERFLRAVSEDDDANAAHYGSVELQRRLSAFAKDDPRKDFFTHIEVGHASRQPAHQAAGARVPYTVKLNDQLGTERVGTLVVTELPGPSPRAWKVVAVAARRPGEAVPSEGGRAPASVGWAVWGAGIGAAVALAFLLEMLLDAAGPGAGRFPDRPVKSGPVKSGPVKSEGGDARGQVPVPLRRVVRRDPQAHRRARHR